MIASLRFLFLVLFGLLVYPSLLQAQVGINSPAGVSPTQDIEVYTRNGFLVQQKYQYASADPTASINNLSCVSNSPSLTASAGILKDPAGDANYSSGQSYSCVQTISITASPPLAGIELVFEDLDTEFYEDYVSVTDNQGYEQRFSGSSPPARLILQGGYVLIKFVTDSDANVGRGFRLRWHALTSEKLSNPTPIAFGSSMQFDSYNSTFKAGYGNIASGLYSTALGLYNAASNFGSIALGGYNTSSNLYSTALGGYNTTSGQFTTALGGYNKAIGQYSIALGYNSMAGGFGSIALGYNAKASAQSSIALGNNSTASGSSSTALGNTNTASGDFATALGFTNTASGDYSTALGRKMNTNNQQGAFMIGDSDPLAQGVTISGVTDQFVARFLNGYFLLTSGDVSPGGGAFGTVRTGVIISKGQNSWGSISDSTKKERFQPIDHSTLLRKIGAMKLTTWNYKGQHQIRHYGPMAQDFYAAFGQDGLGQVGCDTLIYSHDFAGVTFAGVQALTRENEQLKSRLTALEEEKKRTEARLNEVTDLRARLDALERRWLTLSNPVSTAAQADTRQK